MGQLGRRQLRHLLRLRPAAPGLQRPPGLRRPGPGPGCSEKHRDRRADPARHGRGQRLHAAPGRQRPARQRPVRRGLALVRPGAARHRIRLLRHELPQPHAVPELQADHHGTDHRRPAGRPARRGPAACRRSEPVRPGAFVPLLRRLSGGYPPVRGELPDHPGRDLGRWRSQLPAEHAAADQHRRPQPGGAAVHRYRPQHPNLTGVHQW
ncbi:hypothetical protein D3C80_1428150 [compost metagenome]